MACLDLHKDQHIMHHMVLLYMVIMTVFLLISDTCTSQMVCQESGSAIQSYCLVFVFVHHTHLHTYVCSWSNHCISCNCRQKMNWRGQKKNWQPKHKCAIYNECLHPVMYVLYCMLCAYTCCDILLHSLVLHAWSSCPIVQNSLQSWEPALFFALLNITLHVEQKTSFHPWKSVVGSWVSTK